jgi:hypothetical protein
MAILLGQVMIGEEGQSMWRIYASPISGRNLVRSKYFFVTLLSTIILIASGAVGIIFYHPSLEEAIVGFLEGFLILLAVGSISLTIGFKGPDFSQTRRARMIRQEWSLIGLIVGAIAGAAVLAPIVPYILLSIFKIGFSYNLAVAVGISAVISVVISAIFYRINIGLADDLLKKAEV